MELKIIVESSHNIEVLKLFAKEVIEKVYPDYDLGIYISIVDNHGFGIMYDKSENEWV